MRPTDKSMLKKINELRTATIHTKPRRSFISISSELPVGSQADGKLLAQQMKDKRFAAEITKPDSDGNQYCELIVSGKKYRSKIQKVMRTSSE